VRQNSLRLSRAGLTRGADAVRLGRGNVDADAWTSRERWSPGSACSRGLHGTPSYCYSEGYARQPADDPGEYQKVESDGTTHRRKEQSAYEGAEHVASFGNERLSHREEDDAEIERQPHHGGAVEESAKQDARLGCPLAEARTQKGGGKRGSDESVGREPKGGLYVPVQRDARPPEQGGTKKESNGEAPSFQVPCNRWPLSRRG